MSDKPSSGPSGHLGASSRGESGKYQMGAGSKGGHGGSPATGLGGARIEGPSSSSGQIKEGNPTTGAVHGQSPEETSASSGGGGVSLEAFNRWKAESEGPNHEGHFRRNARAGFKAPRDQSPEWRPR